MGHYSVVDVDIARWFAFGESLDAMIDEACAMLAVNPGWEEDGLSVGGRDDAGTIIEPITGAELRRRCDERRLTRDNPEDTP